MIVLVSALCARMAAGLYGLSFKLVAKSLSDSPAALGALATAFGVPALLLPLFIGPLADRFDRRKTLRAVHLVRMLAGLALLAALGAGLAGLPLLYVLAVILGASTVLWSAVGPSVLGKVVPSELMTRAFGIFEATTAAAMTLAPSLGGYLASLWLGAPLAVGAGLLGVAGLALTFVPGDFKVPPRQGKSFGASMVEIFPRLKKYPTVLGLGAAFAMAVLADTTTDSILVLHIIRPGPVGLTESGFGLVLAAASLGQIAGGLVADRAEQRLGLWGCAALSLLVAVPCFAALALSASPVVVTASLTVAFATHGIVRVMSMSTIQRVVPDEERGRVMAVYQFFTFGLEPVGGLLGGFVGQQWSLWAAFGTSAALAFLGFVAFVAIAPRKLETAGP